MQRLEQAHGSASKHNLNRNEKMGARGSILSAIGITLCFQIYQYLISICLHLKSYLDQVLIKFFSPAPE